MNKVKLYLIYIVKKNGIPLMFDDELNIIPFICYNEGPTLRIYLKNVIGEFVRFALDSDIYSDDFEDPDPDCNNVFLNSTTYIIKVSSVPNFQKKVKDWIINCPQQKHTLFQTSDEIWTVEFIDVFSNEYTSILSDI